MAAKLPPILDALRLLPIEVTVDSLSFSPAFFDFDRTVVRIAFHGDD